MFTIDNDLTRLGLGQPESFDSLQFLDSLHLLMKLYKQKSERISLY